ncbi:hypothetical protein DUI87_10917 [Hirundo rustica rustica]|uniref:Reverse transcriptase domain-containing protein n=1 Tax=Hirundo rustica rustica TaxID=333673 RepID=A0A3M0KJF0_HIRRU|nr:hypothetical protein DUI87_10917 [Hirundo rustica rustica]
MATSRGGGPQDRDWGNKVLPTESHGTDSPRSCAQEDRELIWDSQHSFSEDKSCLTNPVSFCDVVTASVDKGRATEVIYLDFCKAFDVGPHHILLSKLETEGFDGVTVRWMRWLDNHIQRFVDNGSKSRWTSVTSDVHQVCTLAPLLLNVLINDRNKGIRCTLSTFADDIKLNGVADTPEGQDGIHRDLDKLENRACGNLTWFNKTKCEVLHLAQGGPCYQSSLGDEQI